MEKKDKVLTVVVPTYNMEKYLRRCLDSLIVSDEQMQMLEVLVINDGSKDTSSQIAHEYQDRYPQTFRVIDKENGNYGSCVNRGLKEATGKYIKILDADDWFDNANFKKYLDTVKDLDVDLVLNDRVTVNAEGKITMNDNAPFPRNKVFNFFPSHTGLAMHRVCYKTENLRNIGYRQTEGISYTDTQWVFYPMTTVKTSWYVPLTIYNYLVGREGQTMNPKVRKKSLSQHFVIFDGMISTYMNGDYPDDVKEWMKSTIFSLMNIIYKETIMKFRDEKNAPLIEFDNRLKENYKEFYEESSEKIVISNKLKYKYVKEWRATGKINTFSIQYLMFKLYQALKPTAKQLILIYTTNHKTV